VEDVIATRDWYHGRHAGVLPDLLVRWNRNAPIRSVRSDAVGALSHEYTDNRTGDHTPDGFCVIAGPGVEPGREGATVRTADFAPSIAAHFGRELECHDGRVFQIAGETQPA
jgi:predicted AlkP superfamily phosphohydrolase/phosphomutase